MLHTLVPLPNFDFYVCLRVKFHKSSFWVLILAAGGPYWVSISQKNGSLLGPYLKAWGSLIVLVSVHQSCHQVVEEIHDDGSPTDKTFEHVPTEIGAEEAEEVWNMKTLKPVSN